jgi:natural product biosynthesis luciferase-like monooxygenase protein
MEKWDEAWRLNTSILIQRLDSTPARLPYAHAGFVGRDAERNAMDLSLFYFADDSAADGDRYRLLLEGARFADANNFTAVWTPERHFHPFGGLYPNPSVTSAAIAAVTERVKIRAGSVVAPLHHPLRIAEEWSVVDNLSHGRAGVSFASGWHATDFALKPENYFGRRELVTEHIRTVQRLWRGETVTAANGVGDLQEVRIFPPPVQPDLPVWLTSAGHVETFRLAGALGMGVLTHLLDQDLGMLTTKITEYRKALAARPDYQGEPGHVVLMVHSYLDETDDAARELVRRPLSDYIRSSLRLSLVSQMDGAGRVDPSQMSDEDMDFLVERAFNRLFEAGLLGTVAKAEATIGRFREAGVDEVACLIDFGLPAETVLMGLRRLNQLREAVHR